MTFFFIIHINYYRLFLTLIQGLNLPKNKVRTVGTASLNLAEFASKAEGKELEISIPLTVSGNATEPRPSLFVSIFSNAT